LLQEVHIRVAVDKFDELFIRRGICVGSLSSVLCTPTGQAAFG
jgi:hypothetical protein